MRRLAMGGLLGPALLAVMIVVCGALRPGYDHVGRFISELGADGSPHAALFNLAGFLPAGLLLAGFGVATIRLLATGRRAVLAGVLLVLFGLGVVIVGLVPCDPGCPQPSVSIQGKVHENVAVLGFLAAIAGVALWSLEFRRMAAYRDLWAYGLLSSIAALALLVAFITSIERRETTGLWQRLLVATLCAWCAVVALRLYRRGRGARAAP